MHLAIAIVLLLVAIGLMALDKAYNPTAPGSPRGLLYYLNPLDPRIWVVAALAGAVAAVAL